MKKMHTGVTVWCIFNIGLGLVLMAISIAVGIDETPLYILGILEIVFYAFALCASSFAMIATILISIISMIFYGSNEFGTIGLAFDILTIFLDFLIFFILKYNGKSAFQVSRQKNDDLAMTSNSNIEELKKCPFCAEEIKKEAVICRFCGKDIQEN